MHATWYALDALARAWGGLVGARLAAAYSQDPGVLRLALDGPDGRAATVHLGARPPHAYRTDGHGRARRNTASLFPAATGRTLTAVRAAHRDRVLTLALDDGTALVAYLYGPRANVLHVGERAAVLAALQGAARLVETDAPAPQPAPFPISAEAFAARLDRAGPPTLPLAARVQRAAAGFDPLLAAEAVFRADVPDDGPLGVGGVLRLWEAVAALDAEAQAAPAPAVLWDGEAPAALTLVPLAHPHGLRPEPFSDADAALRVFHRRRLAREAFTRDRTALLARLDTAATLADTRLARMLDALARPTRADAYEREGHLLMAALGAVPPGADRVVVPDLYGGPPVPLALDPALTPAANAAVRYERARRLRAARAHAEARFDEADAQSRALGALRDAARAATTPEAFDAFRTDHADALAALARAPAEDDARLPYHRVPLGAGYEAWVGRSAADNDALTLRHARPFDLWLHARGVTGSHVVVRVKGRDDVPAPPVVERAAELAAYYSRARTSGLVPVVVTPRKWVRKRKGSPPGAVVVDREERVVLVAPRGA